MSRSLRWYLAFMVLAVGLAASLILVGRLLPDRRPQVASGSVLHLRLTGAWPEQPPINPFDVLRSLRPATFRDLVRAVDEAAADRRVTGLLLHVSRLDMGWGQAGELRDALRRFRQSGKPLHAFLESGGEGTYYLASVAERIQMLETGTLWLDGLHAEVSFWAGPLGRIGVVADLEQVAEYKNAADVMVREDMTPAHREAVSSLLDGLYDELIEALAESLDEAPERVRERLAAGPYTAAEARATGLVHAVGFMEEARDALAEATGGDARDTVPLRRYLRQLPPERGRDRIALVYCVGAIVPGRSGDGVFGGSSMGADTIAEAIRRAHADEGARAIVLRVDSPGGSPSASDIIWKAVADARQAGVPIVVSMADVAASGGYWISMGADRVLAQSGTLTGSIGIYGGKYVLAGLHELIGLNVVSIQRGDNAHVNSSLQPYEPAQREWLRGQLRGIYDVFLNKTADGRGFATAEDVDRIARGRVWTGRQAQELGLVDQVGGLREALDVARELAGLPAGAPVSISIHPRSPTFFELVRDGDLRAFVSREILRAGAEESAAVLPESLRQALAAAPLAAQLDHEAALAYMPYRVRAR